MTPEIEQVQETALTWPEKAAEIKIVDQNSYNLATRTLIEIAGIEKKIKAHHEPIKTAAHSAHKAAVAAEKIFLDPLNKAKTIIKKAVSIWEQEQARIRAEAERKAREEAQKKEEEERLAKALEAEKEGKSEAEIEEIIETVKPIEPVKVEPTFERTSGVTTRETWHAEVTDIKALCQAVTDGAVAVSAVLPNMPVLNSIARTAKGSMSIPGVKAVPDLSVVTR